MLQLDNIDQYGIFGDSRILAVIVKKKLCLIYVYGPTYNNLDPYE